MTPEAQIVVCRSEQGWRFLPGGTQEPAESLVDLGRRELMEEAGAFLESAPRYFAAHVADSSRAEPYRPHLPHPRAYWSYAVAQARIIGGPTNPVKGH
ncbi:MAG: NUDIX domain-containing protein [Nocardioidaceae bacterium]